MKAFILTLILTVCSISVFGQLGKKVASTPAINYDWRPGFVSINEIGGGLGLGEITADYARNFFSVTSVNGYQFSRNVKAGIGVGIQSHNDGLLFPLFFDFRFSLSAQRAVPYLSAAGGIGLNFEDINEKSRIYINPSVGVKYIVAKKVGASLSTGLVMMAARDYRTSFINLKLGIEFKGNELGR